MEYPEIEGVIKRFVTLKNAHSNFYRLASDSKFDELKQASQATNQALSNYLSDAVQQVLTLFTGRTIEQYIETSPGVTEQVFWHQNYQQFLLNEIERCVEANDLHFARVDFLIQVIFAKPPLHLYDVYLVLLPKLIQEYQAANPGVHRLNLIFSLEQLVDYAFKYHDIDPRLLPHLQAIAELEIEETEVSELTYHHVMKALSAINQVDSPESLDIIAQFTQHPSWNVRNLANQLLEG